MWEMKRLEDCLEKVKLTTKVPKKLFLDTGEYPIISQEEEFVSGYWNDSSAVFNIANPVIVYGDHTQHIKYIDFDFVLGADGVKVLCPKSYLDAKYFYYFLSTKPIKSLGYARHYRLLKDVQIPLPPLPEQKRIVAVLDDAFAGIDQAIANTEAARTAAQVMFDSSLNAIFTQRGEGWVEKRLGEVATLQRGFDLPKAQRIAGSVPLVSSSGIIDTHNQAKVAAPGIVTGRSGSIGNVFYIEQDFWPLNTTLYVKDFHANEPEFILHLLRQFDLKKYTSGAGVPTLNRNHVHDELVAVPPLETQIQIVQKLDTLAAQRDALVENYTHKLAHLQELKQSLLQQAFSGKLTQKEQAA